MELRWQRVSLRLREPLVTAWGTLEERVLVRVELEDDEGLVGIGEAAPLEPYDGVGLEEVEAALAAYAGLLAERPSLGPGERYASLRAADPLPQALAAVDLAAWDLAGLREGRAVAELLASRPLARVAVNATVGAIDRAGAAEAAARAVTDGFSCVKLKVGVGDDGGRVAAVRAAIGPEPLLRLDANGAWTVEEAVAAIESLAPAGLELVEEPVHGVEGLRAVRERVPVRIAMDETAAEPGALTVGAADAVCLKLSRCGGISGLLADAVAVRTAGAEVYLSSTFDGPVGIAGALHAAAALRVDLPCGLATLGAFADLEGILAPAGGFIQVPAAPGLGVRQTA